MGVDFQWRVEEQDGSERAKPPSEQASAGGRSSPVLRILLLALLCLLALAAGAYAAVRWRADRGLEAARADLAAVVKTEAAALARGDQEVYRGFQDPSETDDPIESSRTWFTDRLQRDTATAADVQLADMELRQDRAWVWVAYSLDGVPYRRAQFYRQTEGQWRRTQPDTRFWGEPRELETEHFRFIYHEQEEEVVRRMARWAEAFYAIVVRDFAPPRQPGFITVELRPDEAQDEARFSLQQRRISLRSPLLTGVRQDTLAGEALPTRDWPPERVVQELAMDAPTASQLAYHVALMTAWEFYVAQPRRSFNWLMLQALVVQAVDTLLPEMARRPHEFDLLQRAAAANRLLPIANLRPSNRMSNERFEDIYVQSKSLVAYAHEVYGSAAFARILLGLHLREPEETIRLAFQVDPMQFTQGWHAWVRARYGGSV